MQEHFPGHFKPELGQVQYPVGFFQDSLFHLFEQVGDIGFDSLDKYSFSSPFGFDILFYILFICVNQLFPDIPVFVFDFGQEPVS